MAENKKKVVVYTDWLKNFEDLTDEELGKLMRHFFMYINDMNPILDDRLLLVAWKPIQSTLKRDLLKYESFIDKQAINGAKGGRPTKEKETQKTQAFFNKPKKADSDNVNVSVNDNVNDIINSIVPIEYFDLIKKWVDYKKEKKQQYKKIGLETLCRTILKDYPNVKELELAINHSISNGWSGLFKDKNNNQELAYKSQYPPLMTKNEQRFNKFQEASDGAAAIIRAKYGIEEDS